MVLVDTTGKLAFIGHPMSADLEKSIESLLSGGKVLMRGEGSDSASESSAAETDSSKIQEEASNFKSTLGK